MRYYIFRHGETLYTKNYKGFYGWNIFTASIIDEGVPAIVRIGEYLKDKPTDFNVSSQYKRCKQTVKIINQVTGKGFVFDRRLNEFIFETYGNLLRRTKSLLDFINEHLYNNVVICTHGAVIAALVTQILGEEFNWKNRLSYPDPGELIIIEDGKLEKISFRD